MVKKTQETREVKLEVKLDQFKDLLLAYPELSRVKQVLENTRQGVIILTGTRTVDVTLALFTSMLKNDVVTDWRDAYEMVDINELLQDARLIVLPAMWEMPIATVIMNGRAMAAMLRRLYIVLSSDSVTGFIVFGQPSMGLLVNDRENDALFFGFRGINEEGSEEVILEKAQYSNKDVVIDSWGVKPRWDKLIATL
ncbi:MAG: hypothetical protein L7H00_05810 [Vulcanisaeta sp.]|nr:hypothetical protein [Vulcanisaeta sp.]